VIEGYLYLGLSVLSTVLFFVSLREIPRFKMDLHHAGVVNYLVAAAIGLIWNPHSFQEVLAEPGAAKMAIAMGVLFFGLFMLLGITAERVGVMYMTIVSKMAVAIPVLFSWWYFSEEMPVLRILGVILALAAVILVNYRPGNPVKLSNGDSPLLTVLLIAILFVGSGILDSLFKVVNVYYQDSVPNASFTVFLFAVAGAAGLLTLAVRILIRRERIQARSLLGGAIMGIPNFFSIVFLTQSLKYFDASMFYPVNNTLILVVMAVIGLVIYRESFNRWNLIGLVVALGAVAMLV
jgi:drug/metabolite transporter (DMT)-like permease